MTLITFAAARGAAGALPPLSALCLPVSWLLSLTSFSEENISSGYLSGSVRWRGCRETCVLQLKSCHVCAQGCRGRGHMHTGADRAMGSALTAPGCPSAWPRERPACTVPSHGSLSLQG